MKPLRSLLILTTVASLLLPPNISMGSGQAIAHSSYTSNIGLIGDESPAVADNSTVRRSVYADPESSSFSQLEADYQDTSASTELTQRYIVKYKASSMRRSISKFLDNKEKQTEVEPFQHLSPLVENLTQREYLALKVDPQVEFIEPDSIATVCDMTASTAEAETWGYSVLSGSTLYESGATGSGIRIAIIDTGIAAGHPDLPVTEHITVMGSTYSSFDENGHGTRIAGVIGSPRNGIGVKGLAPSAELYSVKAFNSQGQGNYSDIIAAIDWSIEHGMHIINLSFTGPAYSQAMQEAIDRAWESGILLIAAAGNNGTDEIVYPAAYSKVVSVGAVDREGTRAAFSNYGANLDLVAPGSLIYTTSLNGSYTTASGTSVAAAFVTGSAAALWSVYPQWSAREVRAALLQSARLMKEPYYVGYGMVNPEGAMHQQYVRTVTIDDAGTVTGSTYEPQIAQVAAYGKSPDDESTYTLGQEVTTTIFIENAILAVKIIVTDPGGKTVSEELRTDGENANLSANMPIVFSFTPERPGQFQVRYDYYYDTQNGPGYWKSELWKVNVIAASALISVIPDGNSFVQGNPMQIRYVSAKQLAFMELKVEYLEDNSWVNIDSQLIESNPVSWTPTKAGYHRFIIEGEDANGNIIRGQSPDNYYVQSLKLDSPVLKLNPGSRILNISWKEVPNADRYEVIVTGYGDDYQVKEIVDGTFYKAKGLRLGTQYVVSVTAMASSGIRNSSDAALSYASTKTAPPVLIIPGMAGSPLYYAPDNGKKVWDPNPLDAVKGYTFNVLALNEDGNSKNNWGDFWHSINLEDKDGLGNPLEGFYDGLYYGLQAKGYNVRMMNYDFRRDNTDTINDKLKKAINDFLEATGETQLDLVAHSMGGLIATGYVAKYGQEKIHSLTTLGTPYLGAPKFQYVLYTGKFLSNGTGGYDMSIGNEISDGLIQNGMRGLARNMRSAYQLLPPKGYFSAGNGNRFLSMSTGNVRKVLNVTPYSTGYSYYFERKSTATYYDYPSTKAFMLDSTYNGTYVNAAALENAEQFHDSLNLVSTLNSLGNKLHLVVGDEIASIGGVNPNFADGNSLFSVDTTPVNGDGTVPVWSATVGGLFNAHTRFIRDSHTTLPNNPVVIDYVAKLLNDNPADDFTTTLRTEPNAKSNLQITLECPVDIHLTDAQGNRLGYDGQGGFELKIPAASYYLDGDKKTVYLNKDNYDLRINGTGEGFMTYTLQEYNQSDALVKTIRFEDVSITPKTIITSNTDVDHPIVLQVDDNGDGTVDRIIEPTVVLDQSQSTDEEAPFLTYEIMGNKGQNDWYSSDVEVVISAEDSNSGVNRILYSYDDSLYHLYSTPLTFQKEGNVAIYIGASDHNRNVISQQLRIKIDKTPPTEPVIYYEPVDWTNDHVRVSVTHGEDTLSGVYKSQYKIGADGQWLDYTVPLQIKAEGIIPVYARTIDFAGNIGSVASINAKIDKTPPVTGPVISLSETAWTQKDVIATFTDGMDVLSGVQKSQYKLASESKWLDYVSPVLVKTEGQTRIYGRTLDKANNISRETSALIRIDRTPPQAPGAVFLASKTASSAVLAWNSAVDNASGIVGYDVYNGKTLVGSTDKTFIRITDLAPRTEHLFTVRAKDAAGNISVASTQVKVVLTGISVSALRSSFVIKNDGAIWAWGENKGGELGNRTFDRAYTPVKLALQDYESIVSGAEYTVGLKKDGTLWAWGRYVPGSMKQESGGNWVAVPVPLANMGAVISVSAGVLQRVALKADGTVWAWGELVAGDSGNALTPIQIQGLDSVAAVSAGVVHNLALKSDGTVWAWGGNSDGQLGDGTLVDKLRVPVKVSGLSSMIAISAGSHFSMGLKSDGTVWVWGNYNSGPTGDGREKGSLTPVQVSGLTGVVSVKAGSYLGMALKADGTVWAWGTNGSGTLGNGTIQPALTPVRISHLSGVADIAVGEGYVLAVKENGSLWSWGSNWSGGLGVGKEPGHISTTRLPVNIPGSPSDSSPPSVPELKVAGVTGDSVVLEWTEPTDDMAVEGYDISGDAWSASTNVNEMPYKQATSYTVTQLSPETTYNFSVRARDISGKVSTWSNKVTATTGKALPKSLTGGNTSSLVLKSDGTVWFTGDGRYSQLTQVRGIHSVVAISQGKEHALALKSDGTVWSWGKGFMGQLGVPNLYSSETPVQIPGLSQVVSIKAAYSHSMAIKSDGSLWTWGSNINGLLGLGNMNLISQTTPAKVTWLSNVKAVSGGTSNSMALLDNGTVWSWGDNMYGQIGDGTSKVRYSPVMVTGLPEVKAISTGGDHNVVVDVNGIVWSWGNNYSGQLGDGTFESRSRPVRVNGISEAVTDVSAGNSFNLVLTASGKVWSWGDNSVGQLGDGTTGRRVSPIPINSLSEQTMISTGGSHGLSLEKNGQIWSWGGNQSYQLGNGTNSSRTSPGLMLGTGIRTASSQSGKAVELIAVLPDSVTTSSTIPEDTEHYDKQFEVSSPEWGGTDVYASTAPVITEVEQEAGGLYIKWEDSKDNEEVVRYEICFGSKMLGETSAAEWALDKIPDGVRFVTVQALDAAGNPSGPSRTVAISNVGN